MKAIVRNTDGKVLTFVNPPEGWEPQAGFSSVDPQDLPEGWEYLVPSVVVPVELAAWRLKAIVEIMGLKASIDAAIAGLPTQQKIVAQLAWYEGSTIRRDSALLNGMAAALGLSQATVDTMFVQANGIET